MITGTAGEPFTGDLVIYNESMILDADKVSASMPSLLARPNPQVIYAGSAGLKSSTALGTLRRRGLAGKSPSMYFAEWSIVPHDEYCDPSCNSHDELDSLDSVARSNPAYGVRITKDTVQRAREAFEGNEEGFAREVLGVGDYPAPADGWLVIPESWYKATEAPEAAPFARPVFGIDVSPDRRHAAIYAAWRRADDLVGIELVEYHSGTGWLVRRCQELHGRWRSRFVMRRHGAAASLLGEFEASRLPVETLAAADVAAACGQLFDAFRDDTLRHQKKDAVLRRSVAAVDKRALAGAWAWDERNSPVDISPLYAATVAHWGHLKYGPANRSPRDSLMFGTDEIVRLFRIGHFSAGDIKRLHDDGVIADEEFWEIMKQIGM